MKLLRPGSPLLACASQRVGEMTLDCQDGLSPSVFTAFAIRETGMLLTALVTPEFMAALVSIDNLAD